jgi:hypothetical protein
MSLVTICDNCYANWQVDQLVYVEAVEKNCCPVCVNQLVDLCFSRLTNAVIRQIKEELEDM